MVKKVQFDFRKSVIAVAIACIAGYLMGASFYVPAIAYLKSDNGVVGFVYPLIWFVCLLLVSALVIALIGSLYEDEPHRGTLALCGWFYPLMAAVVAFASVVPVMTFTSRLEDSGTPPDVIRTCVWAYDTFGPEPGTKYCESEIILRKYVK